MKKLLLFLLPLAAFSQSICFQANGLHIQTIPCPPSSWGLITGTLANQSDLAAALAGKLGVGTPAALANALTNVCPIGQYSDGSACHPLPSGTAITGVALSSLPSGTLAIGPLPDGTYLPVSIVNTTTANLTPVPVQLPMSGSQMPYPIYAVASTSNVTNDGLIGPPPVGPGNAFFTSVNVSCTVCQD